jgi:S1-C subfamily serine protease
MENAISTRERLLLSGLALILVLLCLGGAGVVYQAGILKTEAQRNNPVAFHPTNAASPITTSSSQPAQAGNQVAPFMVQITAMVERDGKRVPGWTGSGVLVSQDGLILTSAQVAMPGKPYLVTDLLVSLSTIPGQTATAAYYADVVQASGSLDLAVLRIKKDAQSNPVDPASLQLPFATIGDSDLLQNGDTVSILGFSSQGDLGTQREQIAGFKQEAGVSIRAFIQLAQAAGGSYSGGAALDSNGNVIGVLTNGEDPASFNSACVASLDTNRDGQINAEDECTPANRPVGFVRPIRLVHSLLAAAVRGETHMERERATLISLPAQGKILFAEPFLDASNGWVLTGSSSIHDGKLEAILPEAYAVFSTGVAKPFGDVRIEMDYSIDISTGEGDFGALCRYTDGNNFYALEISEDGYYSIWKKVAGKITYLVHWKSSEALPAGESSGHLLFTCIGHTLAILKGGQLIGQVTDETLPAGGIGLVAGTWDKKGLSVSFSKLTVRSAGSQPERPLEILMQDDFSNPATGWWDITNGGAYFDDGLRILVQKRQTDLFARTYQSFTNVRVEVDAMAIGGPNDNDYGVICRYQEATHEFYYFEITSDGKYQIGYYTADRVQIPLSNDQFKPSTAIQLGQMQNHIRAECDGKALILFVNGTQIAMVEDARLSEGSVGLIAGTWSTPGTDIQFDNFVVYKP